jgi:HEAT repeat protein
MTMPLLGRLFVVPLIIVSVIVGGAVVVVLLFGSLTSSKDVTVSELLTKLEGSQGHALIAEALLPKEKELWQTAMELSLRIRRNELTAEEMDEVARRVVVLIRRDMADFEAAALTGADKNADLAAHWDRLRWLLSALAQTGRPEALPVLIEVVGSGRDPYRGAAMEQLAILKAPEGIDPILASFSQDPSPESLMIGCAALSLIATPGDERVIAAIDDVRRRHDGDVAWNAALALARLGSPAGKLTLLDLLDREFWTSGDRYQVRDKDGNVHASPMSEQRVEDYLLEAIAAASRLPDRDLWESIERLKSDASLKVRRVAGEALDQRSGAPAGQPVGADSGA